MGNYKMQICVRHMTVSKAQWHRHFYDVLMEQACDGESDRWKLAEENKLPAPVGKKR